MLKSRRGGDVHGGAVNGGTVHIVQRMEPGGIQTLILDMIGADDDPRSRIYSLELTPDRLIEEWPQLEKWRGRLEGFDRSAGLLPSLALRMARQMRRDRPYLVIVHHIGPMLYGSAAARLAKVPRLIHVEHDAWHYRQEPQNRQIARFSAHLLRPRHVAVSEEVAAGMREVIGKRPITVIPPAIDTSRFRPRPRNQARADLDLGLDHDVRLIGSAGRLVAVKGYDLLIRAVAMLDDEFHLALAGDGELRGELEGLARELGVAGRVHFLGLRTDMEKVLPAYDIFCLSSHNEGLPRVVLEAQSCDVPVVATNVGAMQDAVCPGTGRLVEPGSPQALAEGIREQEKAKTGKGTSRAFVIENYGLEAMMKAYERLAK